MVSQLNQRAKMSTCSYTGESRTLISAFVASMIMASGIPQAAIAGGRWPPPATPSALPQPTPPFTGKIQRYAYDSVPAWPRSPEAPKGAPNVVIILIDDAGFAATDLFGGPVATPELDKFASQGLRYNNFNVTAICSPTRASLLTGRNHHVVGFGNITEAPAGYPGYDTIWNDRTASVAEVLRDNGYSTAAFGKWHNTPYWEISPVGPFDHWPTGLGFEHFYGFMGGEDSEYEPRLYNDTTPVSPPKTADQGYYFTTDITNKAIAWIHTHEALAPHKPYFLYFATGATHAPHQVQRAWIQSYYGKFDEGWDKLRERIFKRQKALGVIPPNTDLTPRPKQLPAWKSLSPEAKRVAERQMAVYAGYMAETDHQVGRLLAAIHAEPDAANTLIFYIVGDNGASGEGGLEGSDHNMVNFGKSPLVSEQIRNIDRLGGPTLDNHYAAAWAWALDTPFRWMKQIAAYFGGTRDPMVVVWPDRIREKGGMRTQFTDVNDIVPTIFQVAGITSPTEVNGIRQLPMNGTSLAYTFNQPYAPARHRVQYFEVYGNRAIYDDGWVAAARHGLPWSIQSDSGNIAKDRWRLFDVTTDFSEAHDLAQEYPAKLTALKRLFDAEAWKNDVYPLGASVAALGAAPSLLAGRKSLVLYPSLPPTPVTALPIFSNPYTITAALNVPKDGVQGTIIAYGSRFGGFALYVKRGRVVYDNNYGGYSHEIIRSNDALSAGRVNVTLKYVPSPQKMARKDVFAHTEGRAELYIGGKLAGEVESYPTPYCYFGSLEVGRSGDSPISKGYEGLFPFTGTIRRVTVQLGSR